MEWRRLELSLFMERPSY